MKALINEIGANQKRLKINSRGVLETVEEERGETYRLFLIKMRNKSTKFIYFLLCYYIILVDVFVYLQYDDPRVLTKVYKLALIVHSIIDRNCKIT